MARRTGRVALVLSVEQRAALSALAASRRAPLREVERAGILLKYAEGLPISTIHRQLGISRPSIYKCIDKALAAGVQAGLKDAYHRPHAPEISEAAKAWVVSVACIKPVALGLAAELWTLRPWRGTSRRRPNGSGFRAWPGRAKARSGAFLTNIN